MSSRNGKDPVFVLRQHQKDVYKAYLAVTFYLEKVFSRGNSNWDVNHAFRFLQTSHARHTRVLGLVFVDSDGRTAPLIPESASAIFWLVDI